MSTTIDQKVVEMRFENKQFESNVATTLSTLDKLKQRLNLSGASKGLEEVGSAAGKLNMPMSSIGSAVETVRAKFSALEVMGVTALANITNQAVNAGKKMVSALTIDPIKTGFSEYETQINAVQTILANTESKGTTLQNVNSALDTLNAYADKTIYNFTEMTKNIGTFTAAGVDLDTSVNAIQGIANLAAVSGSTSQQASTAMYQLSQALSSGTVKLMDWNSVVNAGMGGQVFQDALKETARNHGVAIDKMIKNEGSFRETLKDGWLTSDILTETLSHFTMAAEEGTEQWEAYKKSLMDDGYSAKQAEEIIKLSNTATNAATKVKTFTQLWDTLKESAQSGWTQTWEIIIGDFEEAKGFLTAVSDKIGGMISASAESRNALLSEGFSSGWKQLLGAGIADEEGYKETFKSVAKEHGVSIDEMIKKEKELDSSLSDSEAFQKALRTGFKEGSLSADMLSESVHKTADKMSKMSAEELKAAGYTTEHVEQIKKLSQGLKDGSVSMDDFVKKMSRTSGRENVIQALWNAFDGLMSVVKPIKDAFGEVFKPLKGEQLYSITESLVKFTEKLTLSSERAEKVKRAFKGIFSILDIGKKVITSVVKALFGLSQSEGIGSLADLLLDTAASIGDFFTSLNEGFDTKGFTGILSTIGSGISKVLTSVTGGLSGLGGMLSSVGNWIVKVAKKIGSVIGDVFGWISENVSAGDIFAGLAGGGIFVTAKKLVGFIDKIKDIIDGLFGKDGESKLSSFKETITDVLGSVKDSLNAFTSGIKIASLVGIAVSITLLSSSLSKISKLNGKDISKSLLAMGAMFTMLIQSFKSISKSLSVFSSDGIVKSAIAIVVMAKAIDVLADAMVTMSDLSWPQLLKGILGVGAGLFILVQGAKAIEKTNVSLSTSVSLLALAYSCEMLADALVKFGAMKWDEIGRGLTAMGGALAELVISVSVLNKFGGFNSLLGAGAIWIVVQSLDELSESLKKFGEMSWGEIRVGLTAMGGALAELGIVMGTLGKFSGFSSIFGASSIWIGVQSLDELSENLKKFAEMSWGEVRIGLTAMGGALTELGVVFGVLGKLTGFSGLLGAGAILLGVQSLDELSENLKKFGEMKWDEIGRGLTAMGGALLEVGVISGALGYLAGFAGILGGAAIWVTVQGLGDLADAFQKFASMSWSEIGRGLTAMGGALLEVSVISGGLGYLTGFAGILGGAAIWTTVQGLGDLADALKKFGEMSWDEIGRGLSAMGGALGELALGGFLNTLSIIGAASISEMAEPLGVLADSVKNWSDVTVPEHLGVQLSLLANGVSAFTFAGMGASALSTAAPGVGIMADSVKKWIDVTIPEGLVEKLGTLADGIEKFTFGGMGASALSTAAPALGTMADSVKKWTSVTIPENMGTQLTSLADGIKSFSWAFMGGWSLSAVAGPLGELAGDISKWKDVSIPTGLKDQLIGLSDAVKSFSWAFVGGWSLSAINGPLGDLASDVKKWNDVSMPSNLGTQLTSLADAIKSFSWAFVGGWSLNAITGPLGDLAGDVKKWNGVSIPSGLGDQLKSLANGVKAFSGVGDISKATNGLKSLTSSSEKLSGVNFGSISSGLTLLSSSLQTFASSSGSLSGVGTAIVKNVIDPLNKAASQLPGIGGKLVDALARGIRSKSITVSTAVRTIITNISTAVNSKMSQFDSLGLKLMTALALGIKKSSPKTKSAISAVLKSAVSEINNYRDNFESAGKSLASGFAEGISANTFKAEAKARAMARAAYEAARIALDINSPSKIFRALGYSVPEGFAMGIDKLSRVVSKSALNMSDTAINTVSNSISRIVDIINSDIDAQPTIRPVLDLSDVRAGASSIGGMFNNKATVGVSANINAISSMMRGNQNGNFNDVVGAINKLSKNLGNGGTTNYYNFDGITYDDGSNINDAVKTIVRAVKVGRRV